MWSSAGDRLTLRLPAQLRPASIIHPSIHLPPSSLRVRVVVAHPSSIINIFFPVAVARSFFFSHLRRAFTSRDFSGPPSCHLPLWEVAARQGSFIARSTQVSTSTFLAPNPGRLSIHLSTRPPVTLINNNNLLYSTKYSTVQYSTVSLRFCSRPDLLSLINSILHRRPQIARHPISSTHSTLSPTSLRNHRILDLSSISPKNLYPCSSKSTILIPVTRLLPAGRRSLALPCHLPLISSVPQSTITNSPVVNSTGPGTDRFNLIMPLKQSGGVKPSHSTAAYKEGPAAVAVS